MINYAHRGASEYASEDAMASFYPGIQMGENGTETDVQRTKDGVLVLMHDKTFRCIVGTDVPFSSLSGGGPAKLDIGSNKDVKYAGERLVRLELFGGKPLCFL